jgi:hypothetical protein
MKTIGRARIIRKKPAATVVGLMRLAYARLELKPDVSIPSSVYLFYFVNPTNGHVKGPCDEEQQKCDDTPPKCSACGGDVSSPFFQKRVRNEDFLTDSKTIERKLSVQR